MNDLMSITVTVNGTQYERAVEPRLLLSDFLRHDLGLTGTHVGCEHGVCGACIYTIIKGSVEYPGGQPFALLDEDLEAGKGLTCVGQPCSNLVIKLEYPDEDFEPWL